MSETNAGGNRPLSPHISIYKPIPTMVTSILHRVTGAALYFGTLIFAWWLIAAATSPEYFAQVNGYLSSWLGRIILLGFTWSLVHHILGGIKHLFQDTGRAMGKEFTTKLAYVHVAASIVITVGLWFVAYCVR